MNRAPLLLSALFVAACAQTAEVETAPTASYVRISTEDAYRASVVGKQAVAPDGTTIITNLDGTFTGRRGDEVLGGTWQWAGDKFCSQGFIGPNELPYNCVGVQVKGDTMQIIRADGSVSPEYTLI